MRINKLNKLILGIGLLLGISYMVSAEEDSKDYFSMSLEELVQIEIVSASKRGERLTEVPAAAFVLSNEDIRRSGVTSLPEALRLVPGMQVQRIDADSWSITARGFGGKFANKLLVLIDGRSIYNPSFSGVFWGVHEYLLEDIERIEVIRGPGGTIWGANAVNGVINIVTKSSFDTRGGFVSLGGGNEDHAVVGVRYGEAWNNDEHFRIYAKYLDRDELDYSQQPLRSPFESGIDNVGRVYTGGFRIDKQAAKTLFTLAGQVVRTSGNGVGAGLRIDRSGDEPFVGSEIAHLEGLNASLRGNIIQSLSNGELNINSYVQHRSFDGSVGLYSETNTVDMDAQVYTVLSDSNRLEWGAGYRFIHDIADTRPNSSVGFFTDRPKRDLNYGSLYLQDRQGLWDGAEISLGSKLTYNPFTDFEVQPSVRVKHSLGEDSLLWAAVTRAVRTPSRLEEDYTLYGPTSELVGFDVAAQSIILPGSDNPAESVIAYEIGIRTKVRNLAFDLALFYNDYQDIQWYRLFGEPAIEEFEGVQQLVSRLRSEFELSPRSFGGELEVNWQVKENWRVQATYSFLDIATALPDVAFDVQGSPYQLGSQHKGTFRSLASLSDTVEFDTILRYVGTSVTIPTLAQDATSAGPNFQLDIRTSWTPSKQWRYSIVGQNLLSPSVESPNINGFSLAARQERAVVGRVEMFF